MAKIIQSKNSAGEKVWRGATAAEAKKPVKAPAAEPAKAESKKAKGA